MNKENDLKDTKQAHNTTPTLTLNRVLSHICESLICLCLLLHDNKLSFNTYKTFIRLKRFRLKLLNYSIMTPTW